MGLMLPSGYVLRSMRQRALTTALTAAGMALVVAVFAVVMMLSAGVRATLVATGDAANAVVLSRGASAEITSLLRRDEAAVVQAAPGLAPGLNGRPLAVAEVVAISSLRRRSGDGLSSFTIRGTGANAWALRSGVRLIDGRRPSPGTAEAVVGRALRGSTAGLDVGNTVRIGGRAWTVVGVFDAGGSGFDSELWVDVDQALQAFHRSTYSSMVVRLQDPDRLDDLRALLQADPRVAVDLKPERAFYAEQSEQLTAFIQLLGLSITAIFSLGAVACASITMFAAVATRIPEIGTLRALGFQRASVMAVFIAESLALSLMGAVVGLALAATLGQTEVSTVNGQTLSELAFRLRMTPSIVGGAMAFAVVMGLLGGAAPAWRAAQLPIVDCLRAR